MMSVATNPSHGRPALLRQVNRERVVRSLQAQGPLSRSEVARSTGLGYATAVKICESLEAGGFAEPCAGRQQDSVGRPGNYLRMARETACVLAVTIGPVYVRSAVVGLDGSVLKQRGDQKTAHQYQELLQQLVTLVKEVQSQEKSRILGIGLSVPGLIDSEIGKVTMAPNLPIIDGHDLCADLESLTGMQIKLTGMMEAQFLVEQIRGRAAGLEDFALINYLGGLGVAAASGGHRIGGARGMAGEIGHVVVDPGGILCGCGNRGCLETRATDLALASQVSKKLGRDVSVDELLDIHRESPREIAAEVDSFLDYLAIAIGLTIQAYNPSTVLLLGQFLEKDEGSFERLIEKLPRFCLAPLLEECAVKHTTTYPVNGAGLAIIEELISQLPTKS